MGKLCLPNSHRITNNPYLGEEVALSMNGQMATDLLDARWATGEEPAKGDGYEHPIAGATGEGPPAAFRPRRRLRRVLRPPARRPRPGVAEPVPSEPRSSRNGLSRRQSYSSAPAPASSPGGSLRGPIFPRASPEAMDASRQRRSTWPRSSRAASLTNWWTKAITSPPVKSSPTWTSSRSKPNSGKPRPDLA